MQPMIFTAQDLASDPKRKSKGLLNVSRSKFFSMVRNENFPSANIRMGRTVGWTRDVVESWIEEQRTD